MAKGKATPKTASKRPQSQRKAEDIALAQKRLKKIEAGKFDADKAYAAYTKRRKEYDQAGRNLARGLGKKSFMAAYKRSLNKIIQGEMLASSVKNIVRGIAESEILTTKRQAMAYTKAAHKLAERYRRDIESGTDIVDPETKQELIDTLESLTRADFLRLGDEALKNFTEKALAAGIKVPGKTHKSKTSHNPRHVFWEIFYPPKG